VCEACREGVRERGSGSEKEGKGSDIGCVRHGVTCLFKVITPAHTS
jgi:hypothetical protein